MKKIVMLTASSRRDGNSFAMAKSFEDASIELGNKVIRYDTAYLNIGKCIACDKCFSSDNACVFDDDFNRIARDLIDADAIILVSPVYWYTFPSSLKLAIDKFYSLYNGKHLFNGKKSAIISCCEDNTIEAFNGIIKAYEESFKLMGATLSGKVLIPNVHRIGDIKKTNGELLAAQLAQNLFK